MKDLLNYMYSHGKLSYAQAKEVLLEITEEKYDPMQVSSFLTVFNMRPIIAEELDGFRAALMEKCIRVNLENVDCLDIVGTGGDSKDTFNISTLSAVVMAGAGVKVAKHGNNSVSSKCGSSNVLKYLGYTFSKDEDDIKRHIDKHNLCFFHAPYFHPVMKSVVPIRKALKVKTFFNMLGPLVNPAQPTYSFLGVYNSSIGRLYQTILKKQNRKFAVVYNLDGYDEISLTDHFSIRTQTTTTTIGPEDLLLPKYKASDLWGGDSIADSAKIFMNVLNNTSTTAQKDVVLANAGFGIQMYKGNINLQEAIDIARESIESGSALTNFKNLVN